MLAEKIQIKFFNDFLKYLFNAVVNNKTVIYCAETLPVNNRNLKKEV